MANRPTNDVLPAPTTPVMLEDSYRAIDLVLSSEESDWQGLTDAILAQTTDGAIIDSISVRCVDDSNETRITSAANSMNEMNLLFEAIGAALNTSLGMANLDIREYHQMPLALLQCVLKTCNQIETLSIGSKVTFNTGLVIHCNSNNSCLSLEKKCDIVCDNSPGRIENLQIDFSEHLVNMPNLFSSNGIHFESLEMRMEYATQEAAHPQTTASLRAPGRKHFPAELVSRIHRENSFSMLSSSSTSQDLTQEDEKTRRSGQSIGETDNADLSHPANIISALSTILKEPQHIMMETCSNNLHSRLKSLSLKMESVPSEESLMDIARVLCENTTLTSFQLTWDRPRSNRQTVRRGTRSLAQQVRPVPPSRRDNILKAFEKMLERNYVLEDLLIGLWDLGPMIKYHLALNRGKKRHFLAHDYADIQQEDWLNALTNSLNKKLYDVSLDLNPCGSSFNACSKSRDHFDLRLSSVYYFVRGNPVFLCSSSANINGRTPVET